MNECESKVDTGIDIDQNAESVVRLPQDQRMDRDKLMQYAQAIHWMLKSNGIELKYSDDVPLS